MVTALPRDIGLHPAAMADSIAFITSGLSPQLWPSRAWLPEVETGGTSARFDQQRLDVRASPALLWSRDGDLPKETHYLENVRFLLHFLVALSLLALPSAAFSMPRGASQAQAVEMPCHGMAKHTPNPSEPGQACAKHCMTQVSPVRLSEPVNAPSVANAIDADRMLIVDAKAPRAADPPDTPPPRA